MGWLAIMWLSQPITPYKETLVPHLVAILIYFSQIYSYYIRGDMSPLTTTDRELSDYHTLCSNLGTRYPFLSREEIYFCFFKYLRLERASGARTRDLRFSRHTALRGPPSDSQGGAGVFVAANYLFQPGLAARWKFHVLLHVYMEQFLK